jgi:glycosyltransferase involved in cell wall biosynthesis
MRIGIDGHVLGKGIGGVERYVEKTVELVPDLCPQHQFVVFVSRAGAARAGSDHRCNVEYVTLPASDPLIQRSLILPWAVRRHRIDVLHVQRIAPWLPRRIRILLTVHDLIPIKLAGDYPGLRNWLVRTLTPPSIARADFIVCPTQTICDEVKRLYPDTTAPLSPFFNGVDLAQFGPSSSRPDRGTLQRLGITRPYVFSPGSVEPRRNLETIIAALAQIDPAMRPLLVLSGSIRDVDCHARLLDMAAAIGVADDIRHLGFVLNDDLVDLYGGAKACIAASSEEGFNLLPLEAMACGSPVLCSDIPVHRELYDGVVHFFPTENARLLAAGICRFIAEPGDCHIIGTDSAACIARLSWPAMADRMAAVFDRMAAN